MSKRQPLFLIGLVLFVIVALSPTGTHAQIIRGWDFSISGLMGVAVPMSTDAETNSATGKGRADDLGLETSLSYGGKVSAWLTHFRQQTGMDFGLEFDATFFSPDVKEQPISLSASGGSIDVDAKVLAGNLMIRFPMKINERFPNGRIQWAFGAGGGVQMAKAESADGASDKDTSPVLQFLLNGKYFITRNFALALEYKFTHADQEFTFPNGEFKYTTDVHHVLAGLALHF